MYLLLITLIFIWGRKTIDIVKTFELLEKVYIICRIHSFSRARFLGFIASHRQIIRSGCEAC